MKGILFAFVLVFANVGYAQSLPESPTPHLDRAEWALLATDAAIRGLDVYSTRWAYSAGNKERFLPGFIANHTPVMALYSGGMVYAQYWVARKLSARRHRRLAYAMTAADISVTAPFAIHNLFLPVCKAPDVYLATGCQAPVPGVIYE